MARFSDNYDPNNTQAPAGAPPSDYLTTKASPEEMGAGVGRAVEGLGQTAQEAGNRQFQFELQQQGLANEHAANMAEQQLAIDGGKIYNEFKSLKGLDAANSKDKYVADYANLSNSIREKLGNPAAQRAYDQLATRRLSFAIQDMNGYAATERKAAYKDGRLSALKLSKDEMSKAEVANNPAQFNDAYAGIVFSVNDLYTNPEYGEWRTQSVTTDPKTGKLQFDTSTSDGELAQNSYDNYLQQQVSEGIGKAVTSIAYSEGGSPMKAWDFLQEKKDILSNEAYANISKQLTPAVKAEQVRGTVDQIFNSLPSHSPEYLMLHEPELVQKARDQYKGDYTLADQADARMRGRIDTYRTAMAAQDRAIEMGVIRNINSGKYQSQADLDKDPNFGYLS